MKTINNDRMHSHCGYVAIIGRPNVGKSTLLNRIIQQKISITSRKAQTTRHKILGIKTADNIQVVYVDTPGLHQTKKGTDSAINRYMNKAAAKAMGDVDVIVFITEGTTWLEEDEWILKKIAKRNCHVILVVNKVDQVVPRERLLPHLENLNKKLKFVAMLPISARRGTNVEKLEKEISKLLPESPFFYLPEQITDKTEQFRAAEIIREKIIKSLGQELPYSTSVIIDKFLLEETQTKTGEMSGKKVLQISATIFVEREGQKIIMIGKKGEKLKLIGTRARQELEKVFAQKVFLQLWVKVKEKWTDDENMLRNFGYR